MAFKVISVNIGSFWSCFYTLWTTANNKDSNLDFYFCLYLLPTYKHLVASFPKT